MSNVLNVLSTLLTEAHSRGQYQRTLKQEVPDIDWIRVEKSDIVGAARHVS